MYNYPRRWVFVFFYGRKEKFCTCQSVRGRQTENRTITAVPLLREPDRPSASVQSWQLHGLKAATSSQEKGKYPLVPLNVFGCKVSPKLLNVKKMIYCVFKHMFKLDIRFQLYYFFF